MNCLGVTVVSTGGISTNSMNERKQNLRQQVAQLMQDPNLQVEEPAIQLQAPAEQAIGQDSDLDPNDPNLDALSLASSFAIGENVTHKRSKPEINFEPHIDKYSTTP